MTVITKAKNLVCNLFAIMRAKMTKKKAIALVLILVLIVGGILFALNRGKNARPTMGGSMQGMGGTRTTILQRTTLENTISVTGTVQSNSVTNVTTALAYKVKSINVSVGDTVAEGDVIATLDTTELEKEIEKKKENLADSIDTAQTSYNKAVEKLTEAKANRTKTGTEQDEKVSTADTAYNEAHMALVSTVQERDTAKAAYDTAAAQVAEAKAKYDAAVAAEKAAYAAWEGVSLADPSAEKTAYTTAQGNTRDAETLYNDAKSLYNVDSLYQAYTAKQSVVDTKINTCNSAETALNNAKTARTTAIENADSTVKTCEENVTTAAKALEKSQSSDELEALYEKLDKCTLYAETAGKITAVNATVGSISTSNAIATIQDVDNLTITVSVKEYDVAKLQSGQKAIITNDATGDAEIYGIVTNVSPTASGAAGGMGSSSDVTFDCEVKVTTPNSGLLIGMNAKVQIVIDSREDVFTVPYDAVGTDENGNSVVYVKKGDTFEPVIVTTGMETDYYIEVSGEGLAEGDEVRSSAVESESTITPITEGDSDAAADSSIGFSMGGTMPSGGVVMPSGGAAMPSGGGRPDRG